MRSVGDEGAPTVVELRSSRRRTRGERELLCGHAVPAGTSYYEWVGLVDGEFTTDHRCDRCTRELVG